MDDLDRSQPLAVPNPEKMGELRVQCSKLDQIIDKLRERDKTLFGFCESAVKKSDMDRARIYANELVRVRMLVKAIAQSQLAIECIIIRLENFIELHSMIAELKPLSRMIQSVAGHVSKVMPEIASEMEQLNILVGDTLLESSVDFNQPIINSAQEAYSQDAEAILKEVSSIVEKKLMDDLPEPPPLALTVPAAAFSPEGVDAVQVSFESKADDKQSMREAISITARAKELSGLPSDTLKMLDLDAKSKEKLEECMA